MIEADKRAEAGKKKYAGSLDEWTNWELVQFVDEAMEEALDQYNYLKELRRRLLCQVHGNPQ